jgi:hypothetical protein
MGKTLGSMVEKNLQQIQLQKIQEQMREINKPRKRKTWPKNSKLCMGKKKKIRIHGGSGLSVEFGSGVGLRRWLFFRTVELLKGKTINYIFFF